MDDIQEKWLFIKVWLAVHGIDADDLISKPTERKKGGEING